MNRAKTKRLHTKRLLADLRPHREARKQQNERNARLKAIRDADPRHVAMLDAFVKATRPRPRGPRAFRSVKLKDGTMITTEERN